MTKGVEDIVGRDIGEKKTGGTDAKYLCITPMDCTFLLP
jgi:hypothetical protein